MADFPPNLDDGELWLPSDIFPDEIPSRKSPFYHSELTHLQNLAQHFAALALLQRFRNQTVAKQRLNLAPNSERFEPAVPYDSTGYRRAWHFGFNGSAGVGHGVDGYGIGSRGTWTGCRPAYQYHFVQPVQPQVESFMEARARVLQKQQKQFLQSQNMVLPFRGSRVGGGFVREYGGTGVFLPRINSTTTTNVARKRQSVTNNRKEFQVIPPRNSIKRGVDEERREECHYQLPPPEMGLGLPQDWTY
ncbi:uncharacterized protein LOC132285030 [Cornus florida]|uniref:uncharacterized protein LOC132285030 n=1 Tax=Cornus florida TaxID=4283 RepID=UPI002899DE97|nr:uncharacterized protein LOC132285030 [Cornus florida]